MLTSHHPAPETTPIAAGESLAGCSTPPQQLAALFEAGRKYRSFKYWDKVKVGSSESHLTGQGFNAVKFDPRKPARTVRRNDGNLGMHGAMHWSECRRFSLPEFKRFASFPDLFAFAREFDEGIRQIGNCVPALLMKAIAERILKLFRAAVCRAATNLNSHSSKLILPRSRLRETTIPPSTMGAKGGWFQSMHDKHVFDPLARRPHVSRHSSIRR